MAETKHSLIVTLKNQIIQTTWKEVILHAKIILIKYTTKLEETKTIEKLPVFVVDPKHLFN